MLHIKRNLPTWERVVRIMAGIGIGAALYGGWSSNNVVILLGIAAGATLALTAFVGFCPACWMVGRRSLDQ
jgi:uncharacterized membrane protein